MHLEAMIPVTVPMAFAIIAGICICTIFLMILGGLFAPTLRYRVCSTEPLQNDSGHFLSVLEALTDAKANWHSSFEVLTNGDRFYETELAAIGAAQKNVNLEAYIFDRGEIGGRYVEALAERARAGVNVNVVCDAFGSFGITTNYFADLIRAGGKVAWSNGLRWDRIARIDNRNHRELMIVDGRVGFIGGAGVADQWYKTNGSDARWRELSSRLKATPSTICRLLSPPPGSKPVATFWPPSTFSRQTNRLQKMPSASS